MKTTQTRLLPLLLACMLCLALPAAASGSSPESTGRADKLASLGLFQGTNEGYQLDNTPTRMQGLVMLIRLLGLENEAKSYEESSPFTDLTWGQEYAAYAYANSLTQGTTSTTFSPNVSLNAKSYITFLLRALGYDDSAGDFAWDSVLPFAEEKGLLAAGSADTLATVTLNRGDMVDLSYAALTCALKEGGQTLAEKLCAADVFTEDAGRAAGVLGGTPYIYSYVPFDNSTVTYTAYTDAGTGLKAKVLTVNLDNPNVTVRTAMVNNTVGATAPFKQIVEESGALAVINGNFFNSYDTFKCPIGHVMVDGEFLYGNSGISALGITRDGELRIGRPALFTRLVRSSDGKSWSLYEINTTAQNQYTATIYTPAANSARSLAITAAGHVMTVSNGVIAGYRAVSPGETLPIPADGYLVYMGTDFTSTNYFAVPVVGSTVTMEYYLRTEDPEGFTLDNMESIISGAPRLVQDGAIVTQLDPGFEEARFTTASTPRTAVGVNRKGQLLLVSVPAATTQQMRELMLNLGCVDAINLDGGGSCAMYYDGQYLATPGRELTVTLQVHVKK